MEKKIIELLKELNVPAGNLGFTYLITAIKAAAEDKNTLRGITKEGGIYHIVAKKYGTTVSGAERSIRHGIECGLNETYHEVIEYHFGTNQKITNKNFIATLAYEIKNDEV